jgi:hypothetical protein
MPVEYIQGAELDNLTGSYTDSDGDLYLFASGWTFELKIGNKGSAALLTKTTGITGADAEPNITVVWAADDLDLEAGTYTLQIVANRTSDSRDLFLPHDTITIIEAVE